jgi:hypothetical protein
VLVLAGFAILRLVDGVWWGVVLWILVAPLLYVAVDFLFFGKRRNAEGADAQRKRRVVASRAVPLPDPRRRDPEWTHDEDVSTGSEILRRGRRYDRRHA